MVKNADGSERYVADQMIHDFRRTAVNRREWSGVPRAVAMKRTGHETDADLRAGVARVADYIEALNGSKRPGSRFRRRREARGKCALLLGARGGSRTPTGFRPLDPKSSASASSATLARVKYRIVAGRAIRALRGGAAVISNDFLLP